MPHLSFPLSGHLGGDLAPVALPLEAHAQRALDRLIEQYKSKPNIVALLTVIAGETQLLDTVAAQLATLTSIDDSVGAQLDTLGALVGESRQGFDDVTYRLHLKARVLLNRSSGTTEDILHLFAQLMGDGTTVILQEFFPAALWVSLQGIAVDHTLAPYLVLFLSGAKAGGVKAILQWGEHSAGDSFGFAGAPGSGFDVGYFTSARYA